MENLRAPDTRDKTYLKTVSRDYPNYPPVAKKGRYEPRTWACACGCNERITEKDDRSLRRKYVNDDHKIKANREKLREYQKVYQRARVLKNKESVFQ